MSKEINLKNIKNYISGNVQKLLNDIGGMPIYVQEQVLYRKSKCEDCYSEGKCKECGCSVPAKWFNKRSCNNGKRFPNLMNKEEWNKFKNNNNINT